MTDDKDLAAQAITLLADKHPILLYGILAVVALVVFAKYVPKLITDMKVPSVDSGLVNLVNELQNLVNELQGDVRDLKSSSKEQDAKIHDYAVKITRLTVIMIRLEALLLANGVSIPADLNDEIEELRESL